MKRSSLLRRSPFRRKAPMSRSGWDVTTSDAARSDRPDPALAKVRPHRGLKPIPAKTRRAVRERDGDQCRICEIDLYGGGHIHHRLKRSKGGTNELANLLLLCPRHHAQLDEKESLPLAYSLGYYIYSWEDPELIEVKPWPVECQA